MWTRTCEDVELSIELNEIARRLLRLEPVPEALVLTAEDLAPDAPRPALSCLSGLALPRTEERLRAHPGSTVQFNHVHGATTIRLATKLAQAA